METTIYKNEDVDKIVLDESFITSIRWVEDDRGQMVNMELDIDWNGQEDLLHIDFMRVKTRMIFSWVCNSLIHLKDKHSGALEITSFSYYKDEVGGYQIEFKFDFTPIGYITFQCTDFSFLIASVDKD